jgi:thymidine phosphorylase
VKAGSGAFMARTEEARGLAESLVTVANGAGLPTREARLAPAAGQVVEGIRDFDGVPGGRGQGLVHVGGLVMDVKAGSGAFMARTEEARGLAESLVTVANGASATVTAWKRGSRRRPAR